MAVLDSFDRANSGTLGAGWTDTNPGMSIASNLAVPAGSGYVFAYRSDYTWNSTHSSAAQFQGGGGADMELTVRHQANGNLIMALINSGSNVCYLFKYISGGFTFLHDFGTGPTSGSRYKLEVVGNTYSLYEDSGSGYTQVGSSFVDSTLSGGAPGIGGSAGAPGSWNDWEGTGEVAGDSITFVSPPQYKTFQRIGGFASVPISLTWVGTPTTVEYRFNGGSWTTLIASPAGGAGSGSPSLPEGQGTLEVRFSNDTGVTDSVDDIGVGDVFLVGGDSRSEGRATNLQSYTHATLKSTVFRQDDSWADGDDPVDTGSSIGSHWPLLASQLMEDQGVPVSFITCGTGSTDVAGSANEWATGNSALTEMIAQATAAATGGFKGALFFLGPNASVNATTLSQATYNAAIDQLAVDLSALAGTPKLMVDICGEVGTAFPPDRRAGLDNIRAAILEAVGNNSSVLIGPNLIEQDYADDVHFASDAEEQEVADRQYVAIKNGFYAGSLGRGPRVSLVAAVSLATFRIVFDRDLASGTTYGGFRVTDSGTPITINSATRTGTREVTIVLAAPLSALANGAVSFGSSNDATGQTVPMSTAITLPDARTITIPAEPFYVLAINSPEPARIIIQKA